MYIKHDLLTKKATTRIAFDAEGLPPTAAMRVLLDSIVTWFLGLFVKGTDEPSGSGAVLFETNEGIEYKMFKESMVSKFVERGWEYNPDFEYDEEYYGVLCWTFTDSKQTVMVDEEVVVAMMESRIDVLGEQAAIDQFSHVVVGMLDGSETRTKDRKRRLYKEGTVLRLEHDLSRLIYLYDGEE